MRGDEWSVASQPQRSGSASLWERSWPSEIAGPDLWIQCLSFLHACLLLTFLPSLFFLVNMESTKISSNYEGEVEYKVK